MNVGFMQLSLSHYLSLLDPQILFSRRFSERRSIYYPSSKKGEGQVLHLYNTLQTYSKETTLYGLPLYAFFAVLPFLLFCSFQVIFHYLVLRHPQSVCFIRHKKTLAPF